MIVSNYNITYDGKQFKWDISMLVPDRTFQSLDISCHDPTAETTFHQEPALLKPGVKLREEEIILCKTETADKAWYLAEVHKIYPEEIEVVYYTTPRQPLDDYATATSEQRQEVISKPLSEDLVHSNRYECRQGYHQCTFPHEPITQIVDRETANERIRELDPGQWDQARRERIPEQGIPQNSISCRNPA